MLVLHLMYLFFIITYYFVLFCACCVYADAKMMFTVQARLHIVQARRTVVFRKLVPFRVAPMVVSGAEEIAKRRSTEGETRRNGPERRTGLLRCACTSRARFVTAAINGHFLRIILYIYFLYIKDLYKHFI